MNDRPVGVRLMGGLGNQMFQIAFGVALRAHTGSSVFYDNGGFSGDRYARKSGVSSFPRVAVAAQERGGPVGLKSGRLGGLARRFWRLAPRRWSKCYFERQSFLYDSLALEAPEATYFYGYWQSYRYFQIHAERVRQEFEPSNEDFRCTEKLRSMAAERRCVALHVRRYNEVKAGKKKLSLYRGVDADYCYRSIEKVRPDVRAPVFIFTDDPEWCRANLKISGEVVFVAEHSKLTDAQEMLVMRSCSRHIISNSTFSWWGAWLADSEAVIYPKYWPEAIGPHWRDVIPQTWCGL